MKYATYRSMYIITDHPKNCTDEGSVSPLNQRERKNIERFMYTYIILIIVLSAKPFDICITHV